MRKRIAMMILALTLGGLMPGSTWADKDMTPAEREKKLEKMSKELSLTQDQKNQVRSIKDEKYRKIEDAKREANDKIRSVLTPEQQPKFDKMMMDKK